MLLTEVIGRGRVRYQVGRLRLRDDLQRCRVAAHLHLGLSPTRGEVGQVVSGHVAVHQHGIEGVADRVAAGLGVVDDRQGLLQIGRRVDVGVADAHAADEHRHRGVLHYEIDQAAAAWHQQVDVLAHRQQLSHERPVRRFDELDRVVGHARLARRAGDGAGDGAAGVERVFAAAQDRRAPGLQTEGGDVRRDVRPRLVDAGDHAHRHAHLANDEPVRQGALLEPLADRVGQRGDGAHVGGDSGQPLGREHHPVDDVAGDAGLAGGLQVVLVGAQDLVLMGGQRVSNGEQCPVLRVAADRGEPSRRLFRLAADRLQVYAGGRGHEHAPIERRTGFSRSAELTPKPFGVGLKPGPRLEGVCE